MHTFRDSTGREWVIQIHITALKRCRALVGVDLYKLVDDDLANLDGLLNDPVQLVDTLYVLCRDEAESRGVSDEDFGRAMAGDALERAIAAFLEELADFFPEARKRAVVRKVIEAMTRLDAKMAESVAAIDLEAGPPATNGRPGKPPESSGSTPAPLRSENSP